MRESTHSDFTSIVIRLIISDKQGEELFNDRVLIERDIPHTSPASLFKYAMGKIKFLDRNSPTCRSFTSNLGKMQWDDRLIYSPHFPFNGQNGQLPSDVEPYFEFMVNSWGQCQHEQTPLPPISSSTTDVLDAPPLSHHSVHGAQPQYVHFNVYFSDKIRTGKIGPCGYHAIAINLLSIALQEEDSVTHDNILGRVLDIYRHCTSPYTKIHEFLNRMASFTMKDSCTTAGLKIQYFPGVIMDFFNETFCEIYLANFDKFLTQNIAANDMKITTPLGDDFHGQEKLKSLRDQFESISKMKIAKEGKMNQLRSWLKANNGLQICREERYAEEQVGANSQEKSKELVYWMGEEDFSLLAYSVNKPLLMYFGDPNNKHSSFSAKLYEPKNYTQKTEIVIFNVQTGILQNHFDALVEQCPKTEELINQWQKEEKILDQLKLCESKQDDNNQSYLKVNQEQWKAIVGYGIHDPFFHLPCNQLGLPDFYFISLHQKAIDAFYQGKYQICRSFLIQLKSTVSERFFYEENPYSSVSLHPAALLCLSCYEISIAIRDREKNDDKALQTFQMAEDYLQRFQRSRWASSLDITSFQERLKNHQSQIIQKLAASQVTQTPTKQYATDESFFSQLIHSQSKNKCFESLNDQDGQMIIDVQKLHNLGRFYSHPSTVDSKDIITEIAFRLITLDPGLKHLKKDTPDKTYQQARAMIQRCCDIETLYKEDDIAAEPMDGQDIQVAYQEDGGQEVNVTGIMLLNLYFGELAKQINPLECRVIEGKELVLTDDHGNQKSVTIPKVTPYSTAIDLRLFSTQTPYLAQLIRLFTSLDNYLKEVNQAQPEAIRDQQDHFTNAFNVPLIRLEISIEINNVTLIELFETVQTYAFKASISHLGSGQEKDARSNWVIKAQILFCHYWEHHLTQKERQCLLDLPKPDELLTFISVVSSGGHSFSNKKNTNVYPVNDKGYPKCINLAQKRLFIWLNCNREALKKMDVQKYSFKITEDESNEAKRLSEVSKKQQALKLVSESMSGPNGSEHLSQCLLSDNIKIWDDALEMARLLAAILHHDNNEMQCYLDRHQQFPKEIFSSLQGQELNHTEMNYLINHSVYNQKSLNDLIEEDVPSAVTVHKVPQDIKNQEQALLSFRIMIAFNYSQAATLYELIQLFSRDEQLKLASCFAQEVKTATPELKTHLVVAICALYHDSIKRRLLNNVPKDPVQMMKAINAIDPLLPLTLKASIPPSLSKAIGQLGFINKIEYCADGNVKQNLEFLKKIELNIYEEDDCLDKWAQEIQRNSVSGTKTDVLGKTYNLPNQVSEVIQYALANLEEDPTQFEQTINNKPSCGIRSRFSHWIFGNSKSSTTKIFQYEHKDDISNLKFQL